MTGWTKVILASVVMALTIVGFNVAVWRRMRQASRERLSISPIYCKEIDMAHDDKSRMKLERQADGWIVRVPDDIVAILGLSTGDQITIRPTVKRGEEVRHAMSELRGRLQDYDFDYENSKVAALRD